MTTKIEELYKAVKEEADLLCDTTEEFAGYIRCMKSPAMLTYLVTEAVELARVGKCTEGCGPLDEYNFETTPAEIVEKIKKELSI